MLLLDEFLDKVNNSVDHPTYIQYAATMKQLEEYEISRNVTAVQMKYDDFIDFFSGKDRCRKRTFISKRGHIKRYFEFLQENGLSVNSVYIDSILYEDIEIDKAVHGLFSEIGEFISAVNLLVSDPPQYKNLNFRARIVMLLSWLGLTREDICDLKKSDVDVVNRTISLFDGRVLNEVDSSLITELATLMDITEYQNSKGTTVLSDYQRVLPRVDMDKQFDYNYVGNMKRNAVKAWQSNVDQYPQFKLKSTDRNSLMSSGFYCNLYSLEKSRGTVLTKSEYMMNFDDWYFKWYGIPDKQRQFKLIHFDEYVKWKNIFHNK